MPTVIKRMLTENWINIEINSRTELRVLCPAGYTQVISEMSFSRQSLHLVLATKISCRKKSE